MGFGDILKTLAGIAGPALAPVTGGASMLLPVAAAGIGGALSNTKGARTSTATTTFQEPPAYQGLGDLLRARAMERLKSSADMSGYAASGINTINDTAAGIKQNVDNSLTSRGLAASPIAAQSDVNQQTARGGQISDFLNQIPLLQRQMQGQDLQQAQSIYGARPLGTTQTGVGAGSALGSGIGSAAEMLAYLKGMGHLTAAPSGDMSMGPGY